MHEGAQEDTCGNPHDDIYSLKAYIRLLALISLIQNYPPTSMSPDGSSESKTALTNGDHVTVQSKAKSFDHPLDPLSSTEVRYLASKLSSH